jgi:tRNA threonylcarbamoyladenosine biosynthesis protein TsaB
MGILLLESSSKKIEFGYADFEKIIFKEVLGSDYNADALTYFIKESFDENKIEFKEINYVSLSNGPGSFTGLRIGSAIAKGICFSFDSKDCKLIELPTLDIIANKLKSNKKIIPLIFSNSRTLEFYYCEYKHLSGKLERISDYKIDLIENILKEDAEFIINESLNENIPDDFKNRISDISPASNIPSMLELTKDYIEDKKFGDYQISEPFYMKEFVPGRILKILPD